MLVSKVHIVSNSFQFSITFHLLLILNIKMSINSCFSLKRILIGISFSVILTIVIRKLYRYNMKDNCLTYNTPIVISTWAFSNATKKSNDFLITLFKIKILVYSLYL